jgi:hypothetical protein
MFLIRNLRDGYIMFRMLNQKEHPKGFSVDDECFR